MGHNRACRLASSPTLTCQGVRSLSRSGKSKQEECKLWPNTSGGSLLSLRGRKWWLGVHPHSSGRGRGHYDCLRVSGRQDLRRTGAGSHNVKQTSSGFKPPLLFRLAAKERLDQQDWKGSTSKPSFSLHSPSDQTRSRQSGMAYMTLVHSLQRSHVTSTTSPSAGCNSSHGSRLCTARSSLACRGKRKLG